MESKEKLESRLSEAVRGGLISMTQLEKILIDLEIEFNQVVMRLHMLVCSEQDCGFMQARVNSVERWKAATKEYMEKYSLDIKQFGNVLTNLARIGRVFAEAGSTVDLLWELVQLSNDRSYVQNLNGVVEGIIVEGEEDGEASSERTSSNGSGSK